ncbi:glycosyltransferase [Butyrivibrio sp. CB08]|uniref:glycosyltransferase n=1 Tax=Butyrivibrio sp. CB08 TaxID=2364879 RepID=UPI000EAA59E1|nr:glycosyltransferase [Butyrivibrio sp. CB08]RKM57890.1 glycosyltransferase [Butyrivibrio sp. CB08]
MYRKEDDSSCGTLVVKVCINEWENESRDKKELSVCRELGAKIEVVAKGDIGDYGRVENVDGYEVHRLSSRPVKFLPSSLNRIISVFTWARYVHLLQADIISGHDIIGLTIAWISNWFSKENNKAKLVYDSHEFEIGRNVKRNRLQKWIITKLERLLISKSAFMIVVNDSIADEVVKIHRLKKRPVVVRNIPPRWTVNEEECRYVRSKFLSDFKRAEGPLLMYHGAICCGRGIEECLNVLSLDERLCLILLGKLQSSKYREELEKLIDEYGIYDRVKFYDPVSYEELWKYIGAVDVEMVLIQPIVQSYYFALPNKLFEAIQVHVPVVATDLPEIRRIVEEYKVGELCKKYDINDIYEALSNILNNENVKKEYIENEIKAATELCWEVESEKLKKEYKQLFQ